jgi:hypothetical protein
MAKICYAQDTAVLTIAAAGGSLGVGPEVGYRPTTLFGVRGSASLLDLSHDVDVNDINYRGDLKLTSYGVNADVYPLRNGLRLSAGFRRSNNKVNLDALPSRAVTMGITTYTPDQIGMLKGIVRANKFAPTFTAGYSSNLRKGFLWSLDAGIMLHGTPRIGDLTATGILATSSNLQGDLARERGKINRKVDDYKVYPIVQVSLGYAF